MKNNTKGLLRPRFFDRQQLSAADLQTEQAYVSARFRRHNRFVEGWGVVCGATVGRGESPWEVQVSEGYVITPHGDEVYVQRDAPLDIEAEAKACIGAEPRCPEGDLSGTEVLRIIRANIDPAGRDDRLVGGVPAYNREWVDLLVLRDADLSGYAVEHTIYPAGTFRNYFSLGPRSVFSEGDVIRIHSGSRIHHINPEPGFIHLYRVPRGNVGNWWLNNAYDCIRVLDPNNGLVTQRSFQSGSVRPVGDATLYLVVCPDETLACSQPAVPSNCQPPGGRYEWSRMYETCTIKLLCDLPASHQQESLECEDLEAILCGDAHAPCPPKPAEEDNCVVLATIDVTANGIESIDDLSDRRQMYSQQLLSTYVRHCLIEKEPPKIDEIDPDQIECDPQSETSITAFISGVGLQGATEVFFSAPGIIAEVIDSQSPEQLEILMTVEPDHPVGKYPFWASFDDGRPSLLSIDNGVSVETLPCVTTGNITGTVVTPDGAPLPGIPISSSSGIGAISNAAGAFSFLNLAPGNYTLTATIFGGPSAAITATVFAGQTTSVTIVVGVGGPAEGTITGTVLNILNDPINNVQVSISGVGEDNTNINGRFSFTGLPNGEYAVSLPGFTFVQPQTAFINNGNTVDLVFRVLIPIPAIISRSVNMDSLDLEVASNNPVGEVANIGPARSAKLEGEQIMTVLDLLQTPQEKVMKILGVSESTAAKMHEDALKLIQKEQ